MLTFIDLYAGIGGFRIALERNGAKCVFSSEIDTHCQKTYLANFGVSPNGDIRKIDVSAIPAHDILCAGFPCQPFSLMGHKKGFNDSRGDAFFEIIRILKAKHPKAFLLENVKALTFKNNSETMAKMRAALKDAGYYLILKTLNSCYFGVPQNRERLFFVGLKNEKHYRDFSFPKGCAQKMILKDIAQADVDEKYLLSKKRLETEKKHLQRFHKGSGYAMGLRDLNGIAFTLTSNSGSSQVRNVIVDRTRKKVGVVPEGKNEEFIRKFTPRECARLQGFPDSFKIVVSDAQAYKQFGNAVTVPVAQAIAKKIVERLVD